MRPKLFGFLGGTAALVVVACAHAEGGDGENVALRSQLTIGQLGASFVLDCWGYTSPSGREYAVVGLDNGTAFVEITDPDVPQIVEIIRPTPAQDVKVYQTWVYSTSDIGPLDVIDISDIDNGAVTLVDTLNASSHNIAVNEDSGYLYLAIGGPLVALDLANPAAPVFAGQWDGETHDAQVVTYEDGPYAGREIAFICAGGQRQLRIVDVTDKGDMVELGSTTYPSASYTHQGWLSGDRNHFYLNDELDDIQQTTIIDVGDLASPEFVGNFSASEDATDHNLYWRDGFIFEANYTSGLRVFDACDPVNPVEVGWYDTHPQSGQGFSGAWSNYPLFPSGMVIVSDTSNGLFVLDPSEAVGDGCPSDCPEDIDGNEMIDFDDLLLVLAAWGPCKGGCPEDIDGNEMVDFDDLLRVLASWGPCP